MLGLRDVVFIAQTQSLHQHTQPVSSDHTPVLPLPSSAALGVSVGIFPLLTATPCIPQPPPPNDGVEERGSSDGFDSWRGLKKTQDFYSAKEDRLLNFGSNSFVQAVGDGGGGVSADGGTSACRDCGNKAKKDCSYRRCRTCCKGRGYDCSTHLKSTWIPAARRRERQMSITAGVAAAGDGSASSGSSSGGPKRPRVLANAAATASHSSTSIGTTPGSLGASSVRQDESFKQSLPVQVRAPAVFRCHRVTAIGNGEGEFAYQATVNISGHVFKGFIYDQGVDERNAFPCISELRLESNASGRNIDTPSSPMVSPSEIQPHSAS